MYIKKVAIATRLSCSHIFCIVHCTDRVCVIQSTGALQPQACLMMLLASVQYQCIVLILTLGGIYQKVYWSGALLVNDRCEFQIRKCAGSSKNYLVMFLLFNTIICVCTHNYLIRLLDYKCIQLSTASIQCLCYQYLHFSLLILKLQ